MIGIRGRSAVALVGLAMLAGCGATASTAEPVASSAVASGSVSSPPTPSATASALDTESPQPTPSSAPSPSSGSGGSTCPASDLSIGLGPRLSPATQEDGDILAVRNLGPRACRVRGYLSVRLQLAGSTSLPSVPSRGGLYATSASPTWVTLAPNQDAYVVVAKSQCQFTGGSVVESLEVSAPGSSTVSTVKLPSGSGSLVYCPGQPGQAAASSSALQMSPISASVAAATGA